MKRGGDLFPVPYLKGVRQFPPFAALCLPLPQSLLGRAARCCSRPSSDSTCRRPLILPCAAASVWRDSPPCRGATVGSCCSLRVSHPSERQAASRIIGDKRTASPR